MHIEGALGPELIFALAERNRMHLPYSGLADLESRYEFTDLQSFLDLYYANMAVLRTAEDFADLTRDYLRRAAAAGVRHAEIFFDPQAHVSRGVPLQEVLDGLLDALDSSEREFRSEQRSARGFLRDQPVQRRRGDAGNCCACERDYRWGLDRRRSAIRDAVRGRGCKGAGRGHCRGGACGGGGATRVHWQALDLLGA
ncbi:adenosine deaminase, partial [Rhodococcus hoagii]|nr:adenosine deaminase [Prescottella equi]